MLGELRKWEVHANGEIGFDTFADSLQSLGFPTTGQWGELQRLWAFLREQFGLSLTALLASVANEEDDPVVVGYSRDGE